MLLVLKHVHMKDKVNWAKVKIPSFGMTDAMVKYKNGTLGDSWFEENGSMKQPAKPIHAKWRWKF